MSTETQHGITHMPELSIVIPIYNEAAVLDTLFARLYPALDALKRSYEIIFIDDGSRDRSAAMLRIHISNDPTSLASSICAPMRGTCRHHGGL